MMVPILTAKLLVLIEFQASSDIREAQGGTLPCLSGPRKPRNIDAAHLRPLVSAVKQTEVEDEARRKNRLYAGGFVQGGLGQPDNG